MDPVLKRKVEHVLICLEKDVEARRLRFGFNDVYLVHRCMPDVSLDQASTEVRFLGRMFKYPVVISALTGGPQIASIINRSLAEAAQKLGILLELGSQRPALEDPVLAPSFKIAREVAPDAFIVANIGAVQLTEGGIELAKQAVDMVDANAIAIHLNPLQEAVQPEGEARFKDILEAIRELSKNINLPIIVKETGSGIAREDAVLLERANVSAIDVAGAGGTSWAIVEAYRALNLGDRVRYALGMKFKEWGIPTPVSIVEIRESTTLPIIGSGGIRSGLDVAKAVSLGADLAGLALPLLKPAMVGGRAVVDRLKEVIEELKIAMFLTGSRTVEDLKKANVVLVGLTKEWLESRGIDVFKLAKRR